jgi:tetratricopeptide (TPR) repeat protein
MPGDERARGEACARPGPGHVSRVAPALAWLTAALLALLAAAAGWRAHGAWRLGQARALPAPQQLGALDGVTRAHPRLAEAWHARGRVWRSLAQTGAAGPRLARAERDFARAVHLRPRWSEAWADLGWLRFARGDAAAARADLDRAARLDPTHIGIGVTRAELYARTGDVPEGLRQLARTLDANPGWSIAAALDVALAWTVSPDALAPLVGDEPQRRQLLEQALARRSPAPAGGPD